MTFNKKCNSCSGQLVFDYKNKVLIDDEEEGTQFTFNCKSCDLTHYFDVPEYEIQQQTGEWSY